MLIVFSGLPGTGKSEVAREVGRALEIPVLSVDPVESAILRAGIARGFATGLAAYLVVEAIADEQLAMGQSVIVDAVNAVEEAKDMWRILAGKRRAPLRIIECRCSDEAIHRARLEGRRRALALPEPTWDDVQKRRAEYTSWVEPVLALDSTVACESNVSRAIAWLLDGNGEGSLLDRR